MPPVVAKHACRREQLLNPTQVIRNARADQLPQKFIYVALPVESLEHCIRYRAGAGGRHERDETLRVHRKPVEFQSLKI